jgi:hypothetical protein
MMHKNARSLWQHLEKDEDWKHLRSSVMYKSNHGCFEHFRKNVNLHVCVNGSAFGGSGKIHQHTQFCGHFHNYQCGMPAII